MTGQGALELDIEPPAGTEACRLTIPAVAIQKERGKAPQPPAPAASPRARARIVRDHADVYLPTWATKEMERIRGCWDQAGLPHYPENIAVGVRLVFAYDRPANHFTKAGMRPEKIAAHPIARGGPVRGDVDNLAKMVLDGLSRHEAVLGAFETDDQVMELAARKVFADQIGETQPCTLVEVWPL